MIFIHNIHVPKIMVAAKIQKMNVPNVLSIALLNYNSISLGLTFAPAKAINRQPLSLGCGPCLDYSKHHGNLSTLDLLRNLRC